MVWKLYGKRYYRMSLINRLAGLPETGQDPSQVNRIPVEYFHAMLYELAEGEVTRAEIVSEFEIDVTEEAELDFLINAYNSQPNSAAKAKFVELIRIIFLMAEQGHPNYITNANIVARLNRI